VCLVDDNGVDDISEMAGYGLLLYIRDIKNLQEGTALSPLIRNKRVDKGSNNQ